LVGKWVKAFNSVKDPIKSTISYFIDLQKVGGEDGILGGLAEKFKTMWTGATGFVSSGLGMVTKGFTSLKTGITTAWKATETFAATYLTFGAISAGVGTALVAVKTVTVASAVAMAGYAKSLYAVVAGQTAAATSAGALTTSMGGLSAVVGGMSLNALKAAGIWGLVIGTIAVLVVGLTNKIFGWRDSLKRVNKELEEMKTESSKWVSTYQEGTQELFADIDAMLTYANKSTKINIDYDEAIQGVKEVEERTKGMKKELAGLEKWWKPWHYFGFSEKSKKLKVGIELGEKEEDTFRDKMQGLMDREGVGPKVGSPILAAARKAEMEMMTHGLSGMAKEAAQFKRSLPTEEQLESAWGDLVHTMPDEFEAAVKQLRELQAATDRLKGASQWTEQAKKVDHLNTGIKSLERSLQDSVMSFKASGTEAKIWGLRMEASALGMEVSADRIRRIRMWDFAGKVIDGFNKMEDEGKRLNKEFGLLPEEKYAEEVKKLDSLLKASQISPKVHERALEDLAKRFHDVGDAAKHAHQEVTRFDSALVGSAEDRSRVASYLAGFNRGTGGRDIAKPVSLAGKGAEGDNSAEILKQIRDFIVRNAPRLITLDFANIG
jgi:hypothetical protein